MRRLAQLLCSLTGVLLSSACVPGAFPSEIAQPPGLIVEGQSKCKVKKSQQKPLIVEWPSAERVDLEANREEGPIVVRYDGCEMQLLTQCNAPGSYSYKAVSVKQDTIVIKNEDELHASIPLYAAKFEGNLERSGQLNVTMTMVGLWKLSNPQLSQSDLTGDCAGATHVLSSLTVGAFEFFAGAQAEVGAGVHVAGAGVGAKSSAKRETLTKDGDPTTCDGDGVDEPPQGCGALLRVRVTALGGSEARETAAVGPRPRPMPRPRPTPKPAVARTPAPTPRPAPVPKPPPSSATERKVTPSQVKKVIGARRRSIQHCYENALKTNPTLKGQLRVKFSVATTGRVTVLETSGSLSSASVAKCVTGIFRRMRFPEGVTGTVTYPFVFKPQG